MSRADLGQELGRHAPARLPHALLVVGPALPRGPGPQAGGAAATVAVHRHDVEGAPQAAAGGRGQAGVQRVVAAAGEPPDRARAAACVDAAHRDGVAAVDVLGPGVGRLQSRAVDDRGSGPRRCPTPPRSTRTVGSHPLPFHRRAKTANRPPARPCQHTCRPPSSEATTSWLNDGPSVSLTGSGSLHRPSTKRQAHTPTPAPTGPAEDQPRNAVGGDGRRRTEQVLGPRDDDARPSGSPSGRPAGRRGPPATPARRPAVVAPRGDGGSGRVVARRKRPRRSPALPGQPGRARRAPRRPWRAGRGSARRPRPPTCTAAGRGRARRRCR